MTTTAFLNKTMDRDDLQCPEAETVIRELNALIEVLRSRGLQVSSWYGQFDLSSAERSPERLNRGERYRPLPDAADDRNFPWFLYWEIFWVFHNVPFEAGQRVLDLGGSSSLFSYFLASRGLQVTTVDLQSNLVENADRVTAAMGWKLSNHTMDMRQLSFARSFDHITSICVYEHIPMSFRIEINRRIREILIDGGTFSVTFDYLNPSRLARISSPQDVHHQFVEPSGLRVRGNPEFFDNGKRYLLHPFYSSRSPWLYKLKHLAAGHFRPANLLTAKTAGDYIFGALFLEK